MNLTYSLVLLMGLSACEQVYDLVPGANLNDDGAGGAADDDSNKDPIDKDLNKVDPPGTIVNTSQTYRVPVESGQADILFVVDNSGSMAEEIAITRNSLQGFLGNFVTRGISFNAGLVSTDITELSAANHWRSSDANNPYFNFLNDGPGSLLVRGPSTMHFGSSDLGPQEAYQTLYESLATLTTNGSGSEAGLASAALALSPGRIMPGYWNENFVREEASLDVIIVSDEDESFGSNPSVPGTTTPPNSSAYSRISAPYYNDRLTWVEDTLRSLKPGRPDAVRVHAVTGRAGAPARCPLGAAFGEVGYGVAYAEMVNRFDGTIIDLCDGDFTASLIELGQSIAKHVSRSFILLNPPANADEIRVIIDGVEIDESPTNGFTYDPAKRKVRLNGMDLELRVPAFRVEILYTKVKL